MTTPLAVFRADASPSIGGGHVARCLALAEALAEAGWRTALATRAGTEDTVPAAAQLPRITLPDVAIANEPEALARALPDVCALLVVDHYGWTDAEERASRRFAHRIAVLDDLAAAPHDAEIVLDPTPGRNAAAYSGWVRPGTTVLPGAAWAPLRSAIVAARVPRERRALRRVLVSMGMTDPGNATGRVLAALAAGGFTGDIDVVLGAAAPHRAAIGSMLPPRATLHIDPPDLPAVIARADLAIGAGGVSALERGCLGVPSLLIEIADNQRAAIAGLVAAGAAQSLGPLAALDDPAITSAVHALAADGTALASLSRAALRLCDGLGARRAGTWLAPERSRDGAPVSLRPAGSEDEAMLLSWQSAPGVRAYARNPAVPTPCEHNAWLAATLAHPSRILSIITCGGKPAAMLRLDWLGDADSQEVSIVVSPEHQRQGIGVAALALARRLLPHARLVAEVNPGNAASVALFNAAGFRCKGGARWEHHRASEPVST